MPPHSNISFLCEPELERGLRRNPHGEPQTHDHTSSKSMGPVSQRRTADTGLAATASGRRGGRGAPWAGPPHGARRRLNDSITSYVDDGGK